MLKNGDYVRLLIAPNTRLGNIAGTTVDRGLLKYLFRADPRLPYPLPDVYVFEDEIEVCERPDEKRVSAIRELIKRGQLRPGT